MDILIFGGDLRQISAAKYLKNKGHKVSIFAIDENVLEKHGAKEMFTDSFVPAEINIFPLPVSKDGLNINCPLGKKDYGFTETFSRFSSKNKIYLGMPNTFQKKYFRELKLNITDYYEFEEIQIKNAVATSEGAIELFLTSLPITIMNSETVVFGYGRIGRSLALRMKALGSSVTVCARSKRDIATAHTDGIKSLSIEEFFAAPVPSHCIFNTVPFRLFDKSIAERTKTELFIDLASAPYGCDDEAAGLFGTKYIRAASLPGRTAPVTAGLIIAEAIQSDMEGKVC